MCLTGWLLDRLAALRHRNGEPMTRIYRPASTRDRGSTIAFNLLDSDGRGGSLRASMGLASNVGDVERLVAFIESTYRDRAVGTDGLAPRRG